MDSNCLMLMALLISLAPAKCCPTDCTCDTAKHQVMCTSTSLNGWPAGVPADTKVLYIKGSYSSRLRLRHISSGDLNGLTSIEVLVISDTALDSIDENAFQGLTALKSLDLTFNRLTDLAAGLFQGLDKLFFLYLTGNQHCRLSPSVFKHLKSLRELYLGSMALKTFDVSLFSGLDNLAHLDLSDNEISEVPTSVASPTFLRSLNNLDLQFNQLETLSNDTGQLLTRVLKVELAQNPWHCNCLLKWLRAHKRHVSPPHEGRNHVLCYSPPALRYRAIVSVPDAGFKCIPPAIVKCLDPSPQADGDTFSVSCNISGDPFPDISWVTADGAVTVGRPRGQPRSAHLVVQEPTVTITLQASPVVHGNLTIIAQNVVGMVEETVLVVVRPGTASGTATTVSTTTTTTSDDNTAILVAAGVGGAVLVSASVVVVMLKVRILKVGPSGKGSSPSTGCET